MGTVSASAGLVGMMGGGISTTGAGAAIVAEVKMVRAIECRGKGTASGPSRSSEWFYLGHGGVILEISLTNRLDHSRLHPRVSARDFPKLSVHRGHLVGKLIDSPLIVLPRLSQE